MGILHTTCCELRVAKFISKLTIDCYLSRLLVFTVKLTVIMAELQAMHGVQTLGYDLPGEDQATSDNKIYTYTSLSLNKTQAAPC